MAAPQLDGYQITQEFAAGGMAKIYDATQISLNRPVAIKFLSQKLISHPEAQALFESESLIIAQLNHPNIVQIIDKGISGESQPYFVMEKIKGIDLSEILAQGELPLGKKLDIAIQLCKGLAYAHKNNVIHRDIKPSNLILDQQGHVKILDFGIALTGQQSGNNQTNSSVLGTQGYVAPEQEKDYSNATFASDIYSVGILFYELFGLPSDSADKKSPQRLENKLPNELKQLVQKCCHDNPTHRYSSLTQVRDELLKISQGSHLGQMDLKQVNQENKDLADSFNLLDVLSKSMSKRVYLFQKKSNRQLLVIKRTLGDDSGLKQAKYLSSLKHPNIINIFAAVKSHNSSTIITEYLSGGSLSNQLIQDMNELKFLQQATQICSAIHFAHQNNILHSNLSPNNILFDDKQNLKLSDFGQTCNSNDDPQAARAYQPLANQGFSEHYDIYCMGAIFHHMLYGIPPSSSVSAKLRKVSFRLAKLIDQMIAVDPINRPSSAQQILVELQRIGNAANKRVKSTMGRSLEQEKPRKKKKKKAVKNAKSNHVFWLSITLSVSIVANIALLVKLFFF